MAIDTLKYAKTLETHGVPKEQAEAHAFALEEAVGDVSDIRQAVVGLERAVDALREAVLKLNEDMTALKGDSKTLQTDMVWVKRFSGATALMVFAALLKFLFGG